MALLATEGVLLPRLQERVQVYDYMGPQGVDAVSQNWWFVRSRPSLFDGHRAKPAVRSPV